MKKLLIILLSVTILVNSIGFTNFFAFATDLTIYEDSHTFDFESEKDVMNLQGSSAVTDGNLVLGNANNADDLHNRVSLPFKLESNTEYSFKITFKTNKASSKGQIFRLITANDTGFVGTDVVLTEIYPESNPWIFIPHESSKVISGSFTTGDVTSADKLAIRFSDYKSGQVITIDSIEIGKPTDDEVTIYEDSHVFDFTSEKDAMNLQGNSAVTDGNLVLGNANNADDLHNKVSLPFKLESNTEYSFKITFKTNKAADRPQIFRLITANDTGFVGTDVVLTEIYPESNPWIKIPHEDAKVISCKFATGDVTSADKLALRFSDYKSGQVITIDSIKIGKATDDEVTIYEDSHTFDFESEKDVMNLQGSSAVTDGNLVLGNANNADDLHNKVSLPFKLESNTEYSFKITFKTNKAADRPQIFRLITANDTGFLGTDVVLTEIYPESNPWIKIPHEDAKVISCKFATGDVTSADKLALRFSDYKNGQVITIDSIKIGKATDEDKLTIYEDSHTFDFESEKDVMNLQGSSAVTDGNLVLGNANNADDLHNRVSLPFKLESNTEYSFKITFKTNKAATRGQIFRLITANDTGFLGTDVVLTEVYPESNPWIIIPHEDAKVISGSFTTGDVTSTDKLAIRFSDYKNGQVITIDSMEIGKPTDDEVTIYEDSHTFDFSSEKDVINLQGSSAVTGGRLVLGNANNADDLHNKVSLPFKLESNTEYSFKITFKTNKVATRGQIFRLITANDTSFSGTDVVLTEIYPESNPWIKIPHEDAKVISGSFTTEDITSEDKLAIRFSDYKNGQVIFIDSIEVVKEGKVPSKEEYTIYEGNHLFKFNDNLDLLGKQNSKISNGKLVMYQDFAEGSNSNCFARLPYKLKSNTTYSYTINFECGKNKYNKGIKFQLIAGNDKDFKDFNELSYIVDLWSKPSDSEFSVTKLITTEDLGENNYLCFYYCDFGNMEIAIDDIQIEEIGTIKTYTGSHTFNFNSMADVADITGNAKVINGELNIYGLTGSSTYATNFIRLPFKLESNKTYAYEIKYTASLWKTEKQKSAEFAFIFSNGEKNDGKLITYINGRYGWHKLQNRTETNTGIFRTQNLETGNDSLVVKFNDICGQDIAIDYITIKEVSTTTYKTKHTFEFDEVTDIDETLGNIHVVCKDPVTGKNTLALKSSALGEGTFVRLPFIIEPNKCYKVNIDYRVDGDDLGKIRFDFWPGYNNNNNEHNTFLHLSSSKSLRTVLADVSVESSNSYYNYASSFLTSETQVYDTKNFLCLRFVTENDGNAIFYINKIEIIEADKYDVAVMASINEYNWTKPEINKSLYNDWKQWEISDFIDSKTSVDEQRKSMVPMVIVIIVISCLALSGSATVFIILKKRRSVK